MSVRSSALFVTVVLLAVGAGAFGCVGARPLAMGGAFVGLADDANATYWNPAGLARFDSPKVTAMYTATNRDEINYLGYVAYGGRLTRGSGGYGFSYVSSQTMLGTAHPIRDVPMHPPAATDRHAQSLHPAMAD
ncbi:MAG: hypothetical protein NTU88_06830, partial [Armatimonadetes bacterium]|nr:hypothetical protein [Armatimonadota bacterium]